MMFVQFITIFLFEIVRQVEIKSFHLKIRELLPTSTFFLIRSIKNVKNGIDT